MGDVAEVRPVLFLVAAFSRYGDALDWARSWCESTWGPIALESDRFDFDETDYYDQSMGPEQQKTFFAFDRLMGPGELAERKLASNQAELAYAAEHPAEFARPLNLDPGYITEGKLLLASTKNHAHRIYLDQGIYAEITLRYRGGGWQPWEWTYPDYQRADFQAFFDRCRSHLRQRLREA
jgi:hypothetical protein